MLQIVYMLGHTGPFHNATKGHFTMQQRAVSQSNKGPFHNPTKRHTRLFRNAEKSFISEKVANVSLESVRMMPATKKHGKQIK